MEETENQRCQACGLVLERQEPIAQWEQAADRKPVYCHQHLADCRNPLGLLDAMAIDVDRALG